MDRHEQYFEAMNSMLREALRCAPDHWEMGTLELVSDGDGVTSRLTNPDERRPALLSSKAMDAAAAYHRLMARHGDRWSRATFIFNRVEESAQIQGAFQYDSGDQPAPSTGMGEEEARSDPAVSPMPRPETPPLLVQAAPDGVLRNFTGPIADALQATRIIRVTCLLFCGVALLVTAAEMQSMAFERAMSVGLTLGAPALLLVFWRHPLVAGILVAVAVLAMTASVGAALTEIRESPLLAALLIGIGLVFLLLLVLARRSFNATRLLRRLTQSSPSSS
jgi:hypothetical protein